MLLGKKILNREGVWGREGEKFRFAGGWRMTGSAMEFMEWRWTLIYIESWKEDTK